ncbi:MAG: SpoIIE family protein phosphatase [Aeromicrobium sp.]
MSAKTPGMPADVPCGYLEVGPDGVVTIANQEFLRLADREHDDVVGARTLSELLSVGDRIYFETHFRPTLEMHGEVREIAIELVRPDGTKVPVLVNADLTAAKGGRIMRTVVFEARDRRRYEKELLRARRDAEEAEARARRLAQTLQQTFVPAVVPDIPGLEVVGAYRPAGDGSEVGGDFYDVFQLRSGEWVVAVGDVCGKGVEAAVVTTFVRQSLRALAVQWDDPSQIIQALNTAMLAHGIDRFCTLVLLRLLKEDDDWLVTISSGGHPLPLLVTADGDVSEIGAAGSLVGVLAQPRLDDARYVLGVGDSLVLFTDGVTEARGSAGSFGLEGILATVQDGVTSAGALTDDLLKRVLDFQAGEARDDIAIVSIQVLADAADAGAAAPGLVARRARLDVEQKERALRALQELVADHD